MFKEGHKKVGGRQKGTKNKTVSEIKTLAQQYGAEAIATLVDLMQDSSNESIQASAANSLLDRGYGKAINQTQQLDSQGNVTEEISNLELARWVAHLLNKGLKTVEEKPTSH